MKRVLVVAASGLLVCGGCGEPARASAGPSAEASAGEGTPVQAARVRRATLAVRVGGPGETTATQLQTLRAPFAGSIVSLRAQDGDRVRAGQVLGRIVSRESAAELEGARAMIASARTREERADARRALALARRSVVKTPIRAPEDGVIVSHQASAGALVAEGQDLVAIAASRTIAFVARIDQADLARVRPGQPASVELPAAPGRRAARVHALLPAAAPAGPQSDATVAVRLDFEAAARPPVPGLVGTATIVVAEAENAVVAPAAALLRDDVTGVTRLATVTADGRVHWVEVKSGVRDGEDVQVTTPVLPPGTVVITAGLVGLPEGSRVRVQP